MFRNLLVEPRQDGSSWFCYGGKNPRRRSTGTLIWTAASKAALSRPEVRMGIVILLPLFAMELPRSELLKLEYVLGKCIKSFEYDKTNDNDVYFRVETHRTGDSGQRFHL